MPPWPVNLRGHRPAVVALAVAVSAAVVTVIAAALGARGQVTSAGLVVAGVLFPVGLGALAAGAAQPGVRLRRVLDGLGVGLCLLLTVWLPVSAGPTGGWRTGPGGGWPVAVLVAGLAVPAMVGAGWPVLRQRWAALAGAGAVGCLAAAGASTELSDAAPGWWVPVVLAAAAGPVLVVDGLRRFEEVTARPSGPDGGFAVLGLAIGAAVLAALYRLVMAGSLNRVALALAAVTGIVVAVREALAAMDVRRRTRRMVAREAWLRSLVAGSPDVVLAIDADLVVRWQSPAAARLFGLSDQDVRGRLLVALVHPHDAGPVFEALHAVAGTVVEARLRDGFGRWRRTELEVSSESTDVDGLVLRVRDLGDDGTVWSRHPMAFTDQRTGLADRRELLRTMEARTAGGWSWLLVIDLDGPAADDAVLVEAARRLRGGLDEDDLPARLDSGRFAVLTERGQVRAYALATRLLTVLSAAYSLPGATVYPPVSVGMAPVAGAAGAEEVLSRAALALERARNAAPGRVEWYDESMADALRRRLMVERDLPGALGDGALAVVYQPVVDLATGHPVGVEALLRWRHPELGPVPPAELIPAAETVGLGYAVDEWVLNTACGQLATWVGAGRDLWLSVNVSPVHLADTGWVSTVRDALRDHGLPGRRLMVEVAGDSPAPVTPPVTVADLADRLGALRDLGVRTAIDHFGTGSTPLAHLNRLPVDVLKVDRKLFEEPVLDVVVGRAVRYGLDVIAEGLQAPAHLDAVHAAGCRYGQGNLFHRPAAASHVAGYLASS
jgi:PAS domain S-box-containing protein